MIHIKLLRVFVSICLVMALVAVPLFATACEGEATPPGEEEEVTPPGEEEEEEEAPPWEWPDSLIIGSSSVGTGNYALAMAWGPVLEEDTGMKVRIVPEASGSTKSKWVRTGVTHLDTLSMTTIANIMEATGEFATRDCGPFDVRVCWTTFRTSLGFVVRGDSDIHTIYDIKPGTRIAYVPGTILQKSAVDGLLAWLELTPEDVVLVSYGSMPNSWRGLIDGTCDVTYPAPSSAVTYELESAPCGIRWLPIPTEEEDPEGMARYLAVNPAETFAPATTGVESAQGIRMISTAQFTNVSADISEELMYNLAKWYVENFDLYKDNYAVTEGMTVDVFNLCREIGGITIPIHEGVIRYLKEIGAWTADDDARQEKALELIQRYIEAYQDAIEEADTLGIAIDPENEEWVELWANKKRDLNIPRFGE